MKVNIGASVKARLTKLAHELGREPMSILRLYAQERFLYRVSISGFADRFMLKGGLLLYGRYGFSIRPTVDIDVLFSGDLDERGPDIDMIREIAKIVHPDGITFIADLIKPHGRESNRMGAPVRIDIPWRFVGLNASGSTILDVGVRDIVVPEPQMIDFPVLLEGFASPKIAAYSIETVISEKFDAMVSLGVMNSRMKDFYDIHQVLKRERIRGGTLQQAILTTFKARGTKFEPCPAVFENQFGLEKDRITRWEAFMESINDENGTSLEIVMGDIGKLI